MDSGIRVATCKTDNRRLLDKVFELKPIKREIKSHFNSLRNHSNSKAILQTNVFSNHKQQHLYYNTHIPKPIHIQKVKQHGPSISNEERERRLVETVPQDAERIGNDDRCTKMNEGYQEIGKRS